MSGYALRLDMLRDALGPGDGWGSRPTVHPYEPNGDALLRRVADRLPDELVDDVVALIKLARGNR